MEETKKRHWLGSVPICSFCRQLPQEWFVDGVTTVGRWGIMCEKCFKPYGLGLGPGKGQLYDAKTYERKGG